MGLTEVEEKKIEFAPLKALPEEKELTKLEELGENGGEDVPPHKKTTVGVGGVGCAEGAGPGGSGILESNNDAQQQGTTSSGSAATTPNATYGSGREFWNKRFSGVDKDFEWYCSYAELKVHLDKYNFPREEQNFSGAGEEQAGEGTGTKEEQEKREKEKQLTKSMLESERSENTVCVVEREKQEKEPKEHEQPPVKEQPKEEQPQAGEGEKGVSCSDAVVEGVGDAAAEAASAAAKAAKMFQILIVGSGTSKLGHDMWNDGNFNFFLLNISNL